MADPTPPAKVDISQTVPVSLPNRATVPSIPPREKRRPKLGEFWYVGDQPPATTHGVFQVDQLGIRTRNSGVQNRRVPIDTSSPSVHKEGIEPSASDLSDRHSNQLSYLWWHVGVVFMETCCCLLPRRSSPPSAPTGPLNRFGCLDNPLPHGHLIIGAGLPIGRGLCSHRPGTDLFTFNRTDGNRTRFFTVTG